MTNAHQKSSERLKNVPFRRLSAYSCTATPCSTLPEKHISPVFQGVRDTPPPPQYYCKVKMPPFFYGFTKPGVYDTCQKMGFSVRAA